MRKTFDPSDYRRWAYTVATRLISTVPANHAPDLDDLAQEGLIAIWRASTKYDPERGSLPSLVTRAAERRMREIVYRGRPLLGEGDRTRAHGSRHQTGAVPLEHVELASAPVDPVRIERVAAVRAAVRQLPERERIAVAVLDLLGGTIHDAAPLAGVVPEHVHNLRRRAHSRLRDTLAGVA